jgi:hypothetical protein
MALQLVVASPDAGWVLTLNVGSHLLLGRAAQTHYRLTDSTGWAQPSTPC